MATLILFLLLVGCERPDSPRPADDSGPSPDTDTDVVTELPPDTDTDASWPEPTKFEARCEPTDNTLRFACHVHVEPAQPVQIAFHRADGTGATRVHEGGSVDVEQEIGLYLMAVHSDYTWTASPVAWPDTVVHGTVKTGGAPSDRVPEQIMITGTSSVPYVGTHSPCTDTAIAVIYDTATGALVLYEGVDLEGRFGWYDMVQFTEDHTILGETGTKVIEVDLMGERLVELERGKDYDENLHHDLFKKDGHIYTIFNRGGLQSPVLDGFHIFDATTGQLVVTWEAAAYLDIPENAAGDWMHTNTIWVDDLGDIYLSSYTQHSVIKLVGDWTSPDFGRQIWALAGSDEDGFGMDFSVDWSQVDGADAFEHQHDIRRLADGRLILLDNWHGRGVVVSLDEVAMTSVVEGVYPLTQGVCGPQGTADASSAGNLFFSCSGPYMKEFAPTGGEPVWTGKAECKTTVNAIRWYALEW